MLCTHPLCYLMLPLCYLMLPLCYLMLPLCYLMLPLCYLMLPLCYLMLPLCYLILPLCYLMLPLCYLMLPLPMTLLIEYVPALSWDVTWGALSSQVLHWLTSVLACVVPARLSILQRSAIRTSSEAVPQSADGSPRRWDVLLQYYHIDGRRLHGRLHSEE